MISREKTEIGGNAELKVAEKAVRRECGQERDEGSGRNSNVRHRAKGDGRTASTATPEDRFRGRKEKRKE